MPAKTAQRAEPVFAAFPRYNLKEGPLTFFPIKPMQFEGKVQIMVAGSVNYFYDIVGHRLAEALCNVGLQVTLGTPFNLIPQHCEWLIFVNLYEICHVYDLGFGFGKPSPWLSRIREFQSLARHTAVALLECARVNWFQYNAELLRQTGIGLLIDLGFQDQSADVPSWLRPGYRFVSNGLTNREREIAKQANQTPLERPIPWAFIGHLQPRRARFARDLVSQLQSDGFVYLPGSLQVSEEGPHIGPQQLQAILEHTRYYIWCSHHEYFYVESERFRNALLAGAVPIKVLNDVHPLADLDLPFKYLMLAESSYAAVLHESAFDALRLRLYEDYCRLPSLEENIVAVLSSVSHASASA